MTKYELLDSSNRREYRHNGVEHVSETISLYDLKKFFESNVCTPIGNKRHPYADVLHEWLEGTACQWGYDRSNSNEWYEDMHVTNIEGKKYRIKPPEPVFEYMVVAHNGAVDWMTSEEFENNTQFRFLATGTKRERKL